MNKSSRVHGRDAKIEQKQSKKQSHPLQALSGVGPQLAAKLERIGLSKPEDLLFHLPLRYQDRTRITPVSNLRPGSEAVILGQVEAADIRFGRRRSLLVSVSDGSASILLRFFHFSRNQQQSFREGCWIQCYGEPRRGTRSLEMIHPEYRLFSEKPIPNLEDSLTPIYPSTEGIGPAAMRKLVAQSIQRFLGTLKEALPEPLLDEYELIPLREALQIVHSPPSDVSTDSLIDGTHIAQQRLALEELLAHHLALSQLRTQRERQPAPVFVDAGTNWETLQGLLGFELTQAQHRVIGEVFEDLSRSRPALRLIQGDVGSGKTVVAAAAALRVVDSGYQAALMAPTELLAEQHRKTFEHWFSKLGLETQWLTGKLPSAERRDALENISSGKTKMVIGTHALFQEEVKFSNLGLIIVDEQHRFGVDQRLALRGKGSVNGLVPHQLIMSATPIPRSMAMIFYADLDVSSIDELPPGRKPVTTVVIPDSRRSEIVDRIRDQCLSGQQAYWVCPLIDESEKLQAQAATETYRALQELLPRLNIELIHGRLKSNQKGDIMARFSEGSVDLLVATTVIEVGVDIPNASLMIIENAERLGLAQLHQLRGRVGRGSAQASCVLIYQQPLGKMARDRLGILRETNDGFKIAQKDLEHRGPGELLGTRQTGLQNLRIANLGRDGPLLPKVEKIGKALLRDYPDHIQPLITRWITNGDRYANA